MRDFPVIDISAIQTASPGAMNALGRQVDEICRQTGFLAIVGHGVSKEVIAGASDTSRAFFDLPVDHKLEVRMPYVGYPYGYSPLQAEVVPHLWALPLPRATEYRLPSDVPRRCPIPPSPMQPGIRPRFAR